MPSSSATRATSKSVNSHAARRWTPAQMSAGLHRMVSFGQSLRAAVHYVNELSTAFKPHLLSISSLKRMYDSLPPPLLHPATSSEGQLLQHIHAEQARHREEHPSGAALLTSVEEELLVQWTVREYNMNMPVTKPELKARARELFQQRTGREWDGQLKNWYYAFMGRHPALAMRRPENMAKARLVAEQRDADIARFFVLLKEWRHLPPAQIYAADETGLSGDGSRQKKVIVPAGA